MASASPAFREAAAAAHGAADAAGAAPFRQGSMDADAFMRMCTALFQDRRLSLSAKGLFGLVFTQHQVGSGVTAELIAESVPDGLAAVRAALRELEKFGYLARDQVGEASGAQGPVTYVVTETAGSVRADAARPSAPGESSAFRAAAERREPTAGSGVRERSAVGSAVEGSTAASPASGGSFLVSSQVQEVLLAFPGDFREALRAAAGTDRPRALVNSIERELRTASPHRLADRVRRRWISHGYGRLLAEGALRRPVGAAVALVKAGPCPDPGCEDGRLEDGAACRACAEREKDRRAGPAHRQGRAQQAVPASCASCGAALGADGERCEECVRRARAVGEEVAELIDAAVRNWAAVPGTPIAEVRAKVELAVARARTDAAAAGASPAGQELAARLAALEEVRRARTAGRETGAEQTGVEQTGAEQTGAEKTARGIRAGLTASPDRRGHRGELHLPSQGPRRPDQCTGAEPVRCPGADGAGCPEERTAVGSSGLCVRCRAVLTGSVPLGELEGAPRDM
ncbi:hypothetical protein [Streptomyces smyrnaeus]|uniref:hypothetical protein n=1 Tax=Streptomyces smyrnaeus TaxID=1387713 RepID=UPI0036C2EC69